MKPVLPEELSALLDGELDPARAAEVRKQIEENPLLRDEFNALSTADARWRAVAEAAARPVDIRLPWVSPPATRAGHAARGWFMALVPALGALTVTRLVLKLAGSDAWALAVPSVSLLLLVGLVVLLASPPVESCAASR